MRNMLTHSKPAFYTLFISLRKKPRSRETSEASNRVSKCQIYGQGYCPLFSGHWLSLSQVWRHVSTVSSMTKAPKESRIQFFFSVFFSEPCGLACNKWLTLTYFLLDMNSTSCGLD